MKNIVRASILLLSLMILPATQSASAQTGEQFAGGRYQFIVEGDDLRKYVEFEAMTNGDTTTGMMTFTDETKIPDKEPDGEEPPPPDDGAPQFYIKVEFDKMAVEKNRAVMNGIVRDSSHRTYIGKWVQLVVEDNGIESKVPDQVTWGFCRPPEGSWIPTDAELKYDDGAFMSWWATDAERKDDVGIPSHSYIPGSVKGCAMYSLAAYPFVELQRWEGDIQVRP
jgi:hypothetical protein